MTNKFGNYVVKKLYDVNDSNNQKRMFKYISYMDDWYVKKNAC